MRRPAALPRRRDFVERARRAVLVFRALLLPAFLAADRRAGLDFFPDAAGFLRRRAGRGRFALEREGRGKAITFLVVSASGSPVAADFPAMVPIPPPPPAASPSAAAPAPVAPAATTAGRPCFAWTRFVHRKSASFHGFAIKLSDGILCFLFCRHCHKSKAARLACEFILHKHDILHSTSLCEEILKVGFRRIERKIPNV